MLRLAAFCFGLAIAAAVVALIEPPTATNIVVMVPPVIVSPPPRPPRAVTATTAACPAPSLDAHMHALGRPDERVAHLTVATTDTAWIAAWTDAHVFVSRDGGAHYVQVLDGPGNVADVGFDCFGDAIVVRNASVAIATPAGGDEAWRRVPGLNAARIPARVIGGGPDVVIVGGGPDVAWLSRIASSSDRGRTWRYRDLDTGETDEAFGSEDRDGTIRVAVTDYDCDYQAVSWLRWGPHGSATERVAGFRSKPRVYGDVLLDGADVPDGARAIPAPWPAAVGHGIAYRIVRGRAEPIARGIDGGSPVIDRGGRIWMIDRDGAPRIVD
jgi:hypothetical protein